MFLKKSILFLASPDVGGSLKIHSISKSVSQDSFEIWACARYCGRANCHNNPETTFSKKTDYKEAAKDRSSIVSSGKKDL